MSFAAVSVVAATFGIQNATPWPGGDVGLLADADVGERVGRLARMQVERTHRRALVSDLFFGMDDEERRGGDRHAGYRAD